MKVPASTIATTAPPLRRRHKDRVVASVPRRWAVGALRPRRYRARSGKAGRGVLVLHMRVQDVMSAAPAKSSSPSVAASFWAVPDSMYLFLGNPLVRGSDDWPRNLGK